MDFDINTYLDSLSEDTKCIYLGGRNLTFIPSLERFKNLQTLYCSDNQLTSLPSLNEKLQTLNCQYNKLTSLPCLNENLRVLICDNRCKFCEFLGVLLIISFS